MRNMSQQFEPWTLAHSPPLIPCYSQVRTIRVLASATPFKPLPLCGQLAKGHGEEAKKASTMSQAFYPILDTPLNLLICEAEGGSCRLCLDAVEGCKNPETGKPLNLAGEEGPLSDLQRRFNNDVVPFLDKLDAKAEEVPDHIS